MQGALTDVADREEGYEEESVQRGDPQGDLGDYVIVREEMLAQTVTAEKYHEDTVHSVVYITCSNDGIKADYTYYYFAYKH